MAGSVRRGGADLGASLDERMHLQFEARDDYATMKTMSVEAHVWNVPTAIGGTGNEASAAPTLRPGDERDSDTFGYDSRVLLFAGPCWIVVLESGWQRCGASVPYQHLRGRSMQPNPTQNRYGRRPLLAGACAIAAVLLTGAVVWAGSQLVQGLGIWAFLLTPGWILFLLRIVYDQSDWMHGKVRGAVAWITNPTVGWSGQFVLYDPENPRAFDEIRAHVMTVYPRVTMLADDHGRAVLSLPFAPVVLESTDRRSLDTQLLALDPRAEPRHDVVVIDVPQASSGYRDAVHVMEQHLVPLLDRSAAIARPRKATYVLKAKFPNGNPYFGLCVRHLHPSSRVRFEVSFQELVGGTAQGVTVKDDQLTVSTSEVGAFSVLVRRYLAIA